MYCTLWYSTDDMYSMISTLGQTLYAIYPITHTLWHVSYVLISPMTYVHFIPYKQCPSVYILRYKLYVGWSIPSEMPTASGKSEGNSSSSPTFPRSRRRLPTSAGSSPATSRYLDMAARRSSPYLRPEASGTNDVKLHACLEWQACIALESHNLDKVMVEKAYCST